MHNWIEWLVVIMLFSGYIIYLVLRVRFNLGSLEEKAEYRKTFLPYILISLLLIFVGAALEASYAVLNKDFESAFVCGLMSVLWLIKVVYAFFIDKAIKAFIVKKMPFLNAEANDLIARLLTEKNKKNLITYSSLFVSLVAECVIYRQTQEFSMLIAMALTFVLLALNFVSQQILYYRLKCGLYGTCASEAREIIAYIMEQLKDKDNSGGGLPKLVFKEEELAERVLRTDGGEEYAG